MAAVDGDGARAAAALVRSAIRRSLWVGLGVASLKGSAYWHSRAVLMRAVFFDAMGSLMSLGILAVTQWKVHCAGDARSYPAGKRRFVPLGVLVFSAFMCSTTLTLVLESLHSLLAPSKDVAASSADLVLRRIFEEQPRLRLAYGSARSSDAIQPIYNFGADNEASGSSTAMSMLVICIALQVLLYLYCSNVRRRTESEIVKALVTDHASVIVFDVVVVAVTGFVSLMSSRSGSGQWLRKVDPCASLLLSLANMYCWVTQCIDQLHMLSDRRAGAKDEEAIIGAARRALSSGPLQLCRVDAYHIGEGFRARLEISPAPGEDGPEGVAVALEALDGAVRDACREVHVVDMRLRPRESHDVRSKDFTWVSEYPPPAR